MFKQYINGKLVQGEGAPLPVTNPANGETVGTIFSASSAQAEEALRSADAAFADWSKAPLNYRIGWMRKLREACIARRERFVELVSAESGRLYSAACADFEWCMTSLEYYAEEAKRVSGSTFPNAATADGEVYHICQRRQVGVTVGYLAWNYPLGNAGLKIAPAMASGCTVIVKPSGKTPLATLYLGEVSAEIGLPAGVVNILSGDSRELCPVLSGSSIPRLLSLIGSYETGLEVMRQGATSVKKYALELGGNAPVIVMGDADADEVAANIVAKKTGFAGQTCVNYNRIYVHRSIYKNVLDAVAARLVRMRPGSWKDDIDSPGEIICPVIDLAARERLRSLIDDAVGRGATLVCGGEIPVGRESGCFLTPALLADVTDDMRVSKEEIFGPIIPIQPFDDLDDALVRANKTIFGLSAYFFGHNSKQIAKAVEAFEAGEIFVNGAGGTEQTPHAGIKQSGVGVDKSRWSLDEYYDFKQISMIP